MINLRAQRFSTLTATIAFSSEMEINKLQKWLVLTGCSTHQSKVKAIDGRNSAKFSESCSQFQVRKARIFIQIRPTSYSRKVELFCSVNLVILNVLP